MKSIWFLVDTLFIAFLGRLERLVDGSKKRNK